MIASRMLLTRPRADRVRTTLALNALYRWAYDSGVVEDPQDGTAFDCALIDAIKQLDRDYGTGRHPFEPLEGAPA